LHNGFKVLMKSHLINILKMEQFGGFSKYQAMVKPEPDTVYIPHSHQTWILEINKSSYFVSVLKLFIRIRACIFLESRKGVCRAQFRHNSKGKSHLVLPTWMILVRLYIIWQQNCVYQISPAKISCILNHLSSFN